MPSELLILLGGGGGEEETKGVVRPQKMALPEIAPLTKLS